MNARTALDHQARQLYTRLTLLSDVSAASTTAPIHQGKPGSKELRLAEEPLHLEFLRRYQGCHTDRSREAVLEEFQEKLNRATHSRKPTVDLQTQEGRLIVGRDTRPVETVADAYKYSVRHVHYLRAKAREHDQRHGKRAA